MFSNLFLKIKKNGIYKIKKESLFESIYDLRQFLYQILKEEEEKWHPSVKRWDVIINEMDCNLSEKILELI